MVRKRRLPLDRVQHWEAERPQSICMTQPMGEGVIEPFSWRRAVGEARRVAAYLLSMDLPAGSRIFLEIPDNPGFVELRVVGRLPSQSRELIGIPGACYDAILRNRRPRVVEVSHWRE